ncbi:alpha/beta fold hydrolase [Stenotrophobium rhamnosiphilum]|nr:alpha/beta fold hydrolase [Stenotrophobium rhamnosiphilum]
MLSAPEKSAAQLDINAIEKVFGWMTKPEQRAATDQERKALAGATRHQFSFEGLSLSAWIWGQGKPVLLLHGWESRAAHMAAFVPPLLERGFQVIALDAPAHGESQGEFMDVVKYGRAILATASDLGPFAGVIAHSFGAGAALYAYANGLQVPACVQLAGPSTLTSIMRHLSSLVSLNEQSIAHLRTMLNEHAGVPIEVMDIDALQSGRAHPALLIHDPEDRVVPASNSYELLAAWPDASFLRVAGLGHKRILSDVFVVSSAVGFIAHAQSK